MRKTIPTFQTHQKKFAPLAVVIGVVFTSVLILKSPAACSQVHALCSEKSPVPATTEMIAPGYFHYSDELMKKSLSEQKRVVLYFHAPWCSSCSSFDMELTKDFAKLPDTAIVLQIPYDSASELKTKYNVNYQHTIVLLKTNGDVQEMWLGGDLNSLLEYLKK